MKKIIKLSVIIGLVLSLLLISGAAFGDSLWTENSNSLYKSQPRSFKVGDLITYHRRTGNGQSESIIFQWKGWLTVGRPGNRGAEGCHTRIEG